ncbi:glutamate synthase (NADPH/NADH) small chain [Micromonospora phaseoli]|uniref:Glutamate synthase (NADPH/NADH) small chain n=1 Tax=Micromonospora phaseoli TaxID=1144548 RepID=A0A1H7DKK3_9ACTN|nr:glutamate synthase subunit beta [Micromonospora phaseoli]PZV90936.1 glutamate synthase (NADH) small subunit [Micromonospora phaseoli]GIJ77393.1 dihydropyrimidine dehydrogenase subunit A [Micromonospora phaseoli]SEJ98745.1 glutamate synthase (NADPH/NADH) small chain [Micromonospora phaseoli]
MPDPNGFLRYPRRMPARRPVPVRISDWREVYPPAGEELIREQATRCMDCGIPFCHSDTAGCPLGNRIPDWNDLVRTGNWDAAVESLHATNNFPEFTGRLCPAPCEAACVLGIAGGQPVTIKQVEVEIADAAARGGLLPRPAPTSSGRSVAVVGSGPAGLAAAQQLARAGHAVTVYERDDAIGGLLRYGIPDFKLEKRHIDARLTQLAAEGVVFRTGVNVGVDVTAEQLRAQHDAVLLACGALQGRDTDTRGRQLRGVHQAMAHLVAANRVVAAAGEGRPALATLPDGTPIDAAGKHVVIIGGGDTAADCLGTAHRQGAAGVHQLDLYPIPPRTRDEARDPWPTWPWVLREYPAHEEGGERVFAVAVEEFVDDGTGAVRAVRIVEVTVEKRDGQRILTTVPGTERELPADLVLLAIGFEGTEEQPLLAQFGVARNARGAVESQVDWQTGAEGVFVAGDMHRGASLIVWAIAEGRAAAAAIHSYLGGTGILPAPVHPAAQPLAAR